ncbi:uncharacterized protein LOC144545020 [Carex rostrata]
MNDIVQAVAEGISTLVDVAGEVHADIEISVNEPVDEPSTSTSTSTSTKTNNDAIQVIGNIQQVEEIKSEQLDEIIVNIEAGLESDEPTGTLQAPTDNNSEQKPSIVSNILKPKIVHFETHKAWEFVRFMRDNFGLNVREFLKYIHDNKDLVLSYCQSKEKYCTKDFLEYLLINSCILVFAILSFQNKWNPKEKWYSGVFEKLHQCIMEDSMVFKCAMLSMDCQIPWFVVEAVYTEYSNLKSMFVDIQIDKLALSCFDNLYPKVHESKVNDGTLPKGGFKHLLHMFHWTRSHKGEFLVETRSSQPVKMNRFYIPSATDLQKSATVFRKHGSNSNSVLFTDGRLSGVMELAPWYIFDNSIEIYKALLVFESVYGEFCGFPITAYLACMVHLLQTDDDVRILLTNGIIPSTMGNRNNVLRSVEEIKKILLDDVPMSEELHKLSKRITDHHKRKSPRYFGEFKSRYFATPWITISLIVGIIYFSVNFIESVSAVIYYTN